MNDLESLVGKTIISTEVKYHGDRIELEFSDGTLLRIDAKGFDFMLHYEIDPKDE